MLLDEPETHFTTAMAGASGHSTPSKFQAPSTARHAPNNEYILFQGYYRHGSLHVPCRGQ